jgi:hypothetical protein
MSMLSYIASLVLLLISSLTWASSDQFYAAGSAGIHNSPSNLSQSLVNPVFSVNIDYSLLERFSAGILTNLSLESPRGAHEYYLSFQYHFNRVFQGFRLGLHTGFGYLPFDQDFLNIPSRQSTRMSTGPSLGYDMPMNKKIALATDVASHYFWGQPNGNAIQIMFGVRFRNM